MVVQFPPDLQMKRQMERIRSSVDQYRNAPYRSADWLAGELMTIFDTEPANDVIAASPTLLEALEDMLSGWRYIREQHGDLYGVGWDRCEQAARTAIALAKGAGS